MGPRVVEAEPRQGQAIAMVQQPQGAVGQPA